MAAASMEIGRSKLVGDREIAITRVFDAPRDLVFAALDRSEGDRAVVGATRFHHDHVLDGGGSGRHVEVHHARSGWHELSERGPV